MAEWYEKQIGPLPAGIWVGVVVVGVGASILVNRKSKSSGSTASTAPAAADTSALTDATAGAFGSLPGGVNLGGVVALPGGVPAGQVTYTAPSTGSAITDNNSWYNAAADQLIAKGYDPGLVDSALRDYLNGNVPTAAEQAVVNLALQLLGVPPQPVLTIAPPTTPTPTPVNPTPTANYGPVYPTEVDGQAPPGVICPPQAPVLIQGANGYTCATQAQYNILQAYLGHN